MVAAAVVGGGGAGGGLGGLGKVGGESELSECFVSIILQNLMKSCGFQ